VMPKFSEVSKDRLRQCHPELQSVFNDVVRIFDCSILCGFRDEATQNELFAQGRDTEGLILDRSRVVTYAQWPDSNHNRMPSPAADVAPYPIDWKDLKRMHLFGGFVLGYAKAIDVHLRWGGDWNQNWQVKDEKFRDLVHFELE
jgi:peptidoglycan L-alanyl-D-glutamate endopeptidase CwlK